MMTEYYIDCPIKFALGMWGKHEGDIDAAIKVVTENPLLDPDFKTAALYEFGKMKAAEELGDDVWFMEDAFKLVANKDDWRAPIKAVIRPGDFDRCKKAVEYYTATELTKRYDPDTGLYIVEADGYRNGPAGP